MECIYQTLRPMTLEECVKFISELDPKYSDLENNFRYITKIVRKEDE